MAQLLNPQQQNFRFSLNIKVRRLHMAMQMKKNMLCWDSTPVWSKSLPGYVQIQQDACMSHSILGIHFMRDKKNNISTACFAFPYVKYFINIWHILQMAMQNMLYTINFVISPHSSNLNYCYYSITCLVIKAMHLYVMSQCHNVTSLPPLVKLDPSIIHIAVQERIFSSRLNQTWKCILFIF